MRVHACMSGGGAERKGERNKERERIPSRLCTDCLHRVRRKAWIMTWVMIHDHDLSQKSRVYAQPTKLPRHPENLVFILLKKFFANVYLILRETARAWAGEEQTERGTQNPKQAPGSELSAQSPTQGSNSQAVRSWPELKSDA